MSIVELASAVPSTSTSLSSAAFTLLSPSIGVVMMGEVGVWLSRVMVVVAGVLVLPAESVDVIEMLMVPLSSPLMSASLLSKVQLPVPLVVTCAVTGGFVPSSNCMSIVELASAVPVTSTSLSSAVFTMLSPSMGVVMVGEVGVWLSSVTAPVADALVLPAVSVDVTEMLMVPLSSPLMSASLLSKVQLPVPLVVT